MCGPAHLKKETLHKSHQYYRTWYQWLQFWRMNMFALHSVPSQSHISFSCNEEKQDFRVLKMPNVKNGFSLLLAVITKGLVNKGSRDRCCLHFFQCENCGKITLWLKTSHQPNLDIPGKRQGKQTMHIEYSPLGLFAVLLKKFKWRLCTHVLE